MMKKLLVSVVAAVMLFSFGFITPVQAQGVTPEQIEASIADGLEWLDGQQQHGGPSDGSWRFTPTDVHPTYDVAVTALVVLKYEDRAKELGKDPFDVINYEYAQNVIDGFNYIFKYAGSDANGIHFEALDSQANTFYDHVDVYTTGTVMMAIAASKNPSRVMTTGPLAFQLNYYQALQGMMDFMVLAQNDGLGAHPYTGGWPYYLNNPNDVRCDNSISGYSIAGIGYAAAAFPEGFGLNVPSSVSLGLNTWINLIQVNDGGPYDGGSSYSPAFGAVNSVNTLKTGNLLYELAFVGAPVVDPVDHRVGRALNYIGTYWDIPGGQTANNNGWQGDYQAMFTMMKGLQAYGLNDVPGHPNWFDDVAGYIVDNQVDGHWQATKGGEIESSATISTAFALLTLERAVLPLQRSSDLGDAPSSRNSANVTMTTGYGNGSQANFPTVFNPILPGPSGPIHLDAKGYAWLGQNVTCEEEADAGWDQDGANNIGPAHYMANQDKADDGVDTDSVDLSHSLLTQFRFRATNASGNTTAPACINVWFDWNRDGDWDDQDASTGNAPEWAVQNYMITLPAGAYNYNFTTPQFMSYNPQGIRPIWMRITLTGGPGPIDHDHHGGPFDDTIPGNLGKGGSGPAPDGLWKGGETEDYLLGASDLGDAPSSRNSGNVTMMASYGNGSQANFPTVFKPALPGPIGPIHLSSKGFAWLGPDVTAEQEADTGWDQEGSGVNNINPSVGIFDRDNADDGLIFPNPSFWNNSGTKNLQFRATNASSTNSTTAYVNVWFDWNRDGDWGDNNASTGFVPEWAVKNDTITLLPGDFNRVFLSPPFMTYNPQGAQIILTRITLTDTNVLEANGDGSGPAEGYPYGETEDHRLGGIAFASTSITPNMVQVPYGGTVTLNVMQSNTGNVPLTSPRVEVTTGNRTGVDIPPMTLIRDSPSFVNGDTGGDGILGAGETWIWTVTGVSINATTTFTAMGHGFDPLGNDITYPDYALEKSETKVIAYCQVATATGAGLASISSSDGVIEDLTAVAEGTLPAEEKPNITFPFGLFSYKITGLIPGQSAEVSITLPSPLDQDTQYWEYQLKHYSDNIHFGHIIENTIEITLTDGGPGDADGEANGTIVHTGGPAIPVPDITTLSPLPNGMIGVAYATTLAASGGLTPYFWNATGLPAGLIISHGGNISGIPTVSGNFSVNVTVTDASSPPKSSMKTLALQVDGVPSGPVPVITTLSLPTGELGAFYLNKMAASGGQTPYSWNGTGLPSGLSMSHGGNISGVLTASGNFSVNVMVTDASSPPNTASKTLALSVSGATGHISAVLQGGSRPDGGWVVPLTVKFFTPGTDVMTGTPAYSFNLTTGLSAGAAIAQCTNIAPGVYDITAVSEHTLVNVKRNIAINVSDIGLSFGNLLEGNANNDVKVNIQDFGVLASSYGKSEGAAGFKPQADFDRNGKVNITDFGLLAKNYGKQSPIEVPYQEIPQAAPLNPAFLKYFQEDRGSDYGYIPPTMDLSHLNDSPPASSNSFSLMTFDPKFDWREKPELPGKVTEVKDQGDAGTCWIFGTLASLESRIGIAEYQTYNQLYDFSEQNLVLAVDPSHVYQAADRADSGGNSLISTDTLTKWGTVLETTQPYDIDALRDPDTVCIRDPLPLHRINDFRMVASLGISDDDITNIKTAIQTYGPVMASFWVDEGKMWPGLGNMHDGFIYDYPSFYRYDQYNNIYYPANHMVCIVGWDDTVYNNHGAWIVKNSWSKNLWGNSGYFYLCYGSANLQEVGLYHGTDSKGYEAYNAAKHIYYYDEAGIMGFTGYGDNNVWMRNVFTADPSGMLTSVSFWTTSNNVQYQIQIRGSGENPLGAPQSGVCPEFGYYTIPLSTPILLTEHQMFKVDVQLTAPENEHRPLPVEFFSLGYCEPEIQPGSYIKHLDNDQWTPADWYGFNVCLRATVLEGAASITTFTTLEPAPVQTAYEQTVTFNATVTATTGTSIGQVTLMDNNTPLETKTLDNGQAIFTTFALSVGTHPIYAVYNGYANFNTSTSTTIYYVVGPTQLVFLTGTQTIMAGSPSAIFTIENRDPTNNSAVNVHGNAIVNLTSNPNTGMFAATADGLFSSSFNINIASGSSTASFFYKNNTAGMFDIYATRPITGLLPGTQQVTVNPAIPPNTVWYVDPTGTNDINHGILPGALAFNTITYALTHASYGHTIYVAEGIYNEKIILKNGVKIFGAGWETTTIDGGGYGYVVTATNVGPDTTLDGFTITNGVGMNYSGGGGMRNTNSSPLINRCLFSANSATNLMASGGGMYNLNSSPTLTNCTFSDNSASNGGGMYNLYSSPVSTNCTFSNNSADSGGGMYNDSSSPVSTNCTFSANPATYGGGMYNTDSSMPTLTVCNFYGNSAIYGGGMYNGDWMLNNSGSSPKLTGCIFSGNSATSDSGSGGGMYNAGSSPISTNCTFSDNSAINGGGMYNVGGNFNSNSSPVSTNCFFSANNSATYGGGMYNGYGSLPISTNCTFSGNPASYGGGMYNDFGSSANLTECIFSGNSAILGDGYGGGMYNTGSSPVTTNCTFSTNSANYGGGMYNGYGSLPISTNCTFSGNPATYGGGMYNDFGSSANLTECIFSGNSAILGDGYGGGMYNTGSSPVSTNCTFSTNSANYGGGIYNDSGSEPTLNGCIFLVNSADSGGGMYNTSSSPVSTNCTFSGNLATSGSGHGGGMYNIGSSSVSTNCSFSTNSANYGGGMSNTDGSAPVSTNCSFSSNSAIWGGGMYNHLSSPEMRVIACTFSDNISIYVHDGVPLLPGGGGMYNDSSSPGVTNCLFSGNTGSGMFNINSSPKLLSCRFSNNSASISPFFASYGGGMKNEFFSTPTLINCIFFGNSAYLGKGGGIYNNDSSPNVINCTFSRNVSTQGGGGMYNEADSMPWVTNCILYGDSLPEIHDQEGSVTTVTFSDVQGGYPGLNNIVDDPTFFNPAEGDLQLNPSSACIDAGNNDFVPSYVTTDFKGNNRFVDKHGQGPIVDMGAYETN